MEHVQGERYLWCMPKKTRSEVEPLSRATSLCLPVVQALVGRGYSSAAAIQEFLFLDAEQSVGDPALLKDAQKAVDRIIQAIKKKEKILIAGDYDVDGVTSSSLLLLCLQPLGAEVNFFLPNRVRDGYGLSATTVQRAAASGYKVIITVDNGITAFAAGEEAVRLGIDLIITDHHRPHEKVPAAYAIVNPHQESCRYPYKLFAGVGVSFKIMSLLYRVLNKPLPIKVYELLLLGTVADVVPLTGENRFWVRYGLQEVNKSESYALSVLKKNGRCERPYLTSRDIGFFLAPQINALGRLDDARDGVKFLIGNDTQITDQVGEVLIRLNEARKNLEKTIVSSLVEDITTKRIDIEKSLIIVAASESWPAGVIGLVAGRLASVYQRPTFLFHKTKDGLLKGSCRSIPAVNLFHALQHVSDLLITFGGHAQAAGLSLRIENLPALQERLSAYITSVTTPADFVPLLELEGELSLSEVTKKLAADLTYLEPFGCENPPPTFYIPRATLLEPPILLKESHVKCTIFADGVIKPVIFFNRPELYPRLKDSFGETWAFAVQLLENHWNGQVRFELQGLDILRGGCA